MGYHASQYRDKIKELQFITAYIADKGSVAKIVRDGGWIETKKSPSLNGD